QIKEKFIPVWKSIQGSVPMDSKLVRERFKRHGILLEKEGSKRLKTAEGSGIEEKDSDDHDKVMNLQQWAVLVKKEVLVDVAPVAVKSPICD
ncbi:hypothetical protein Tco_0515638, partial [Tanacetum coccineum]